MTFNLHSFIDQIESIVAHFRFTLNDDQQDEKMAADNGQRTLLIDHFDHLHRRFFFFFCLPI